MRGSNLKPTTLNGKFSGKISFNELEFSEFYSAKVGFNTKTNGKIYFPPGLIGKIIYILIPKEVKNE